MRRTMSRLRKPAIAGSLAMVGALTLAACGGGSSPAAAGKSGSSRAGATPAGQKVNGGTVSFALPPSTTPNWIWPFENLAVFTVDNGWLEQPLYRPLYWFGGHNQSPTLDLGLSAANAPAYSDGGKVVTITLKNWKWSNGENVDAKDVIFWMHMMKAEKTNWADYTPGLFPDNVVSVRATGPQTVRFTLDKKYSSDWFTYNELSQVTPMPMAWDVTKLGAKPGSGGCTQSVAKCAAVYKFLDGQSKDLSSYATSPVWGVVDGPWRLKSFSTSGQITFVPNTKWSGDPKPQLAAVKFLPYTTDSSEFDELKSSSNIDIGYIPSEDLPPKPVSQALPQTSPAGPSYRLTPLYSYSVNYFAENFHNPTLGPTFNQLYFRKALQEVMDQELDASKAYRGYAYPNYGPVPVKPASKWLSPLARADKPVYPFSPTNAKKLLTGHGWTEQNGVMTCTRPGTAAGECGQGVKAGTALNVHLLFMTGSAALKLTMVQLKSDAAKAGINVIESEAPFNTVVGNDVPCKPTQKSCKWQVANWGAGWIYSPDYLPTGESILQTGAGSNTGSYSSPAMDAAIAKTLTTSGTGPLYAYQDLVAEQLPVVFQANPYNVDAVNKKVGGVVLNPIGTLNMEYWYLTK